MKKNKTILSFIIQEVRPERLTDQKKGLPNEFAWLTNRQGEFYLGYTVKDYSTKMQTCTAAPPSAGRCEFLRRNRCLTETEKGLCL